MTDQTKNVEILQKEVDVVAAELAEAKKLEDEALQKIQAEAATLKAEAILNEVKTAKEEANIKLKSLEGKTDAISKAEIVKLEAEIKKYEAMLITLNSTKDELITLKAGVVAPIVDENDDKNKDEEKDEEKPEEEKKNRFRRQIDGFSDKTEENHGLKNAGRIVGGIGVVALGIRGIKKLINRGKNKTPDTTNSTTPPQTPEKKSFWQKPFGKFLKWTGIGTGAYYLIHGLYTGKWGLSDFLDWNKRNETDPEDLKSRYEKNVDAKLKPKYESFGEMVDKYHTGLGSTDSLGTLEDDENKETTIPKGCIPAVLDDTYDNVGDILDTDDYIFDKWRYAGQHLWDTVTTMGSKVAGLLFKPLVGAVKGLKETMFGSDGEPNDEFKKWAETEDLTRDEQLGNLMQKYGMVRTYLGEKQSQLERKYAKQWVIGQGNKNPTENDIDEALEDDKCLDIITARVEASFLNKKIVSLDEDGSAVSALDAEGIYDDTASESTLALTEEIKNRKKEVVPDDTIWERAKNTTDINKDDALLTELNEVSTNFSTYMEDGFLKRNRVESFASRSGLDFDELWNSKANDIEIMMEEMGFNKEIERFKIANADFMNKLNQKTLTQQDIVDFKKSIDDYFALEQQVLLEAERKNKADGRKSGFEIFGTWIFGRVTAVFEWVMTPTGLAIVGIVAGIKMVFGINIPKAVWNSLGKPVLRKVKDITFKTVGRGMETVMRRTNVTRFGGINKRTKLKIYGKGDITKFATDLKKGRIDFDIAQSVFSARSNVRGKATTFNDFLVDELGLIDSQGLKANKQATLLRKYCTGNVRELIKGGKTDYGVLAKQLNLYHEKLMGGMVTGKRLELMEELFVKAKFTKAADIETIVKNIDNIDELKIKDLDGKQIRTLAESLGKDVSILSDATKVNAKIDEIKKTVTTTVDVIDNIKLKEITKNIDDQLVIMKKTLTDMGTEAKPGASFSKIRVNYYEKSIEGLENFKKQAHLMTEVDFNTIKKMTKYGFELNSIAKLRGIIEADAAGVIDNAVKQGDVRLLRDILRDDAINDVNLLKKVTKTDIDEVVGNLDVLIKKSAAVTDDVTPLLKNMDNIFRLFTKLT